MSPLQGVSFYLKSLLKAVTYVDNFILRFVASVEYCKQS